MALPTLSSAGCDVLALYAGSQLTAAEHDSLVAMLSTDERERHARFRFDEDRCTYAVAHVLLRRMLSAHTRLPIVEFSFSIGPQGRPEIAEPAAARHLRFNLSHTRGLSACAIAQHSAVGVDVERLDRAVELRAVAQRVFSEEECAGLDALSGEAQRQRFFELWTLKEAYIKAIGQGLSAPLRAITFRPTACDPVQISFAAELAQDAAAWRHCRCIPSPEHRIAVSVRNASARVCFARVSVSELLTASA